MANETKKVKLRVSPKGNAAHVQAPRQEVDVEVQETASVPATGKLPAVQANELAVDINSPMGNTDITALLPSKLVTYEETVAYLRPYTKKELFRIGTVTLAQSIRPVIEAIGACTNLPISTMARSDLWTMAYWLRLNSFRRTPFVVDWECEAPEHYLEVTKGNKPRSSLKNSTVLDQSSLDVKALDVPALNVLHQELSALGFKLSLETVQSMLEAEKLTSLTHEQHYLLEFAAHLHTDHGTTLMKRIQLLEAGEYPDEVLELLHQVVKLDAASGPNETVKVKCGVCGEETTVPVATSLAAFFPLSV